MIRRARNILGNRRGMGAIIIAMSMAGIGAILITAFFILSANQRRAAERGAGAQLSKDISMAGVEIVNQLISSQTLVTTGAQYPPVDADCQAKNTCNTNYVMSPTGTSFGGANPPTVTMNWNFTKGFVKSSGAPGNQLAKVTFRICNPLPDPSKREDVEKAIPNIFKPGPTLPAGCQTMDTTINFLNAKSGVFLELEAMSQ